MRFGMLSGAAAMALALAACGQGQEQGEVSTEANLVNDTAVNDVLGASENQGAPAMPNDAAGFVAALAASDLYEIQSSGLARQKAQSAELRSFAQRLEREHGGSSGELKAAAAKAGVPVTPALDAEKQGMIDKLKAASGADFDAAYIDQQRLAHQKTLMLLQNYAAGGDNDALKAFAEKAQSMVEQHTDSLNYMRK